MQCKLQSITLPKTFDLDALDLDRGMFDEGAYDNHHSSTKSTDPKPFSTSPTSSPYPKPSSISASLSFVFDQINAIEKERSEKDQTLQKIRAWRKLKKSQIDMKLGLGVANHSGIDAKLVDSVYVLIGSERLEKLMATKKEVEVVHQWPEWIELMEMMRMRRKATGKERQRHRRWKEEDRI
ncbi:hypothetical protein C1H46_038954 [Malus baccata]|uniref:Uncharacterized protein n=1 Tax=Malus baccata TaxID=106549 RepID=A0A540KMR6_MALBA|nr:hypothetical protein C1H46_038954 [Malus baccata]